MQYEKEVAFLTKEIERRELNGDGHGAKFLADFCEEMKERHGSIWPRLTMEAMGYRC